MRRAFSKLASYPGDMHVDALVAAGTTPDGFDKFLASDDTMSIRCEEFQDVELFPVQIQRLPIQGYFSQRLIYPQTGD
jgi:hypothetical protein